MVMDEYDGDHYDFVVLHNDFTGIGRRICLYFLYFSWRGALGFLSLGHRNNFNSKLEVYCVLLIVLLIFTNVIFQIHFSFSKNSILGIGLSLLGGTMAFIYFKQSQNIIKIMHLTASQILAVRFHLTVLVLLPILFKPDISHQLSSNNLLSLLLLAFISMIIPLYFGQKALEKISSEHHAIISSLCPVATGILQEIIFKDVKLSQTIVYMLYSLIIFGYYVVKKYKLKEEVNV